jgi:N-acetylmuramoyl-L-alanine amidase
MNIFQRFREFIRNLFRGKAGADNVSGPQDSSEIPSKTKETVSDAEHAVLKTGTLTGANEAASSQGRYLWCLDNGHGQGTSGKRSPLLGNGDRFYEYEFNRDIVARIMAGLDALGIQYHQICPELEGDLPLLTRVQRANQLDSARPKFFLSIHANAFGNGTTWTSANGIESWFYKGSDKGARLASALQHELVKANGWVDRGIRYNGNTNQAFYVLRKTNMPAALTENGYYTNQNQCLQMMNPAVRQKIAQAHINAIRKIETEGIENITLHSKIVQIG